MESPTAPNAAPAGRRQATRAYAWVVAPLLIFALTRAVIFVAGVAGRVVFLDEIGLGPWHSHPDNLALDVWARWDSGYYQDIATRGYWYEPGVPYSAVVFFPLYPLLIRLGAAILGDVTLAGVVISHLCLLLALLFLYRLALLELGDEATARRAVLYISIFPTAFFFSAVYTESAFLLFSVAGVYFARRRWWLPAALMGLAASATRIVGLAVYVFLLLEWWRVYGPAVRHRLRGEAAGQDEPRGVWPALLVIQLAAAGLLLYMAYLWRRFGSPFVFLEAQAAWDKQAGGSPLQLIYDLADGLQALSAGNASLLWLIPDALAGLVALVVAPFVWRRLGRNYALYTVLCLLVPMLSGNSQSIIRYVVVVFPIFLLLAHWGRREMVDRAIVVGSAVLLGVLLTVFVNWGWVA